MIFNMIRFVEWPEPVKSAESDYLVICTAGNSNMSQALQSLSGKTVKGRNVQIKQAGRQSDLPRCHVLFMGEMSRATTHTYIEASRKGAVLTISDTKGFAEGGGMIGFIILQGKVSFEINQQNATRQGLRISSRLLKLAHRVLGSH